jgi:glyoxylase-like metal-dependent hydrolase (beta-lactamase superfamily II)
MAGAGYFVRQILEHLFVVGELPAEEGDRVSDCHVYLIVGQNSVLAVDAGSGGSWPFVQATARRFGFEEMAIAEVLVTHGHADHARGLTEFETAGALTVTSAYTAEHLDSAEDADVIFDTDEVLDLFEFRPRAILTPGHTPGCASYRITVDGVDCLFVGDLVQVDGGLGWGGSEGFSQERVLASLKKLATMPAPDMLLAGHGYTDDAMGVIRKAIGHGERGEWIVWTETRPRMPA